MFRALRFCLITALMFFTGCNGSGSDSATENTMTEKTPLDSPEAQQLLFHPKVTRETSAPEHAVNINVEVEPGIHIGCRLFTADPKAPTIIFFHGNGEIVQDYDEIGPLYLRQNINFLITDFRGYGWSDGTPSFSALLGDSLVLFKELKKYLSENQYSPILFLMGRSLGSACAIEIASKHDREISGLIIESGFAETLPLARTLGIDLSSLSISEEDTFNNGHKIQQVTKPTFLLHGQLDTLIPLWQAEKLHAECGARSKELQVVPGADHNSLIAIGGMYYFQAIKQFIDKVSGENDWRKRRKKYKNDM